MTPVDLFRNHSVEAHSGAEPSDEFAHIPLTIPALRRVRNHLERRDGGTQAPRAIRDHDRDDALPCCNTRHLSSVATFARSDYNSPPRHKPLEPPAG